MAGTLHDLEKTEIGKAILADDPLALKQLLLTEDVYYKDKKSNTYLHLIATIYKPKVFYLVASSGIDINAKNKYGNTALHNSALQNEPGHVMDLMASGVDPYIENNFGLKAIDIKTNKNWRVLYSFYEPGLINAIKDHDVNKVCFLLENWSRVDLIINQTGITLRQFTASLGFHDLVSMFDRYKASLDMIYGMLEFDTDRVFNAVQKGACNFNFVRNAALKTHPIQLAMRFGREDFVKWMCKPPYKEITPANVNYLVHVKNYFRGPLFFEALTLHNCSKDTRDKIIRILMESGADMRAKDDRGRTFPMYLIDVLDEDEVLPHFIAAFREFGACISDRDEFGLTVRNIAELQRKHKIIEIVDFEIVRLIRSSDVDTLVTLAINAYKDFYFELHHRNTFHFAAGNDDDRVQRCLEWIASFNKNVEKLHQLICVEEDDMEIFSMIRNDVKSGELEMLLRARDVGGRCSLHLTVMRERLSLTQFVVRRDPKTMQIVDNLGRKALHYACASNTPFLEQILRGFGDEDTQDVFWRLPNQYSHSRSSSAPSPALGESCLAVEKDSCCINHQQHSFQSTLGTIRVYEEMVKLIHDDELAEKERVQLVRKLLEKHKINLSDMERELTPGSIPFLVNFQDVVVLAAEKCQHAMLKVLLFYGAPVHRLRLIRLRGRGEPKCLTLRRCAELCGWSDLVHYIDRSSKTVKFEAARSLKSDDNVEYS